MSNPYSPPWTISDPRGQFRRYYLPKPSILVNRSSIGGINRFRRPVSGSGLRTMSVSFNLGADSRPQNGNRIDSRPGLVRSTSFSHPPVQYRSGLTRDNRVYGLIARANQRRLYHVTRYNPLPKSSIVLVSNSTISPSSAQSSKRKVHPIRRHNSDLAFKDFDTKCKLIFDGSQFDATLLTRHTKDGITFGLVKTRGSDDHSRSSCSQRYSQNLPSGDSGIDELCSCENQRSLNRLGDPQVAVRMAKDDTGSVQCVRVDNCVLKKATSSIIIGPLKETVASPPVLGRCNSNLGSRNAITVTNSGHGNQSRGSPNLKSPTIVKEVMKSFNNPPHQSLPSNMNVTIKHDEIEQRINATLSNSFNSSSVKDNCKHFDDISLESNSRTDSMEKRPLKPPRRPCSADLSVSEQQNDNLVEEIYLAPESGPVIESCKQTSQQNRKEGETSVDHFVVVAIDFGTTFSGYAFSFTKNPDAIHMMRKWNDAGDPDMANHKIPTILLLRPDESFHAFGSAARESYHALVPEEANKWLYFEKFKMALHSEQNLNRNTHLTSLNGKKVPALTIFGHSLRYFKEQALNQLSEQCGSKIFNEDVRWVITVPAIWRQTAKQLMRIAAYQAGLGSPDDSNHVLIAPEPEAAAVYCRNLKIDQLSPENLTHNGRPSPDSAKESLKSTEQAVCLEKGTKYMVIDCGGGTVDITVHEIHDDLRSLKELHRASGCPYGSVQVDGEFEKMLVEIFGAKLMKDFRSKLPSGYVSLMEAFESRKRSVNTQSTTLFNIPLPFSFIQSVRKWKGCSVENLVKKYDKPQVVFDSRLGILRIQPALMSKFFQPICEKIVVHINSILASKDCNGVGYLFLVGGFAESQLVQSYIRAAFSSRVQVVIPRGVSSATLRGAVLFGLNPSLISVRRSRMTYGIGILNRFVHGFHPPSKLVVRDGIEWCSDIFDKFVLTDQSIAAGEVVTRSYTPAKSGQNLIVLHIYCSQRDDVRFITDEGVQRCGTLMLDLKDLKDACNNNKPDKEKEPCKPIKPIANSPEKTENKLQAKDKSNEEPREIQTEMIFGESEVKVQAVDMASNRRVRAEIDFLAL